jgi:4-hydroxy-tetrahydrodipicolinate reductase
MGQAIFIVGAGGRMGKRVAALAHEAGSRVVDEIEKADVVIDFSSPEATSKILGLAQKFKKPVVMGTTGHGIDNQELIQAASREIPLLFSPNFSLGMASCLEAVKLLIKQLGPSWSVEIVEAHHVHKKDRPSGTALALQKAVGREVPIHSIRAGDIVGDHTVILAGPGERIELKHQVHTRDAFAIGALNAARFLVGQKPKLYTIHDLLYENN